MARIINTADLIDGEALDRNANDWVYNGLDCCVTLEIRDELLSQLDQIAAATYDFSRALQAPILEMSQRGILVDEETRRKVLHNYDQQAVQLEEQLNEIVRDGLDFDVSQTGRGDKGKWHRSPARVKNLFYDVMGLQVYRKRDAQGNWSPTVDRDALEKISDNFFAEPIARHILTLRDLDKKRSWLRTDIDADGRMRTNFNIAGTNTGRLASSASDFGTGGNQQNVDRELRSVFVADPGWKFCNIDLEQGDARNVGAVCWQLFVDTMGEDYAGSYLDACESGDLHTTVCRMSRPDLPWTGDPVADRKIADQLAYRQDSYRQLAKKLGHGTNYYGTPRTMAQHTKVATKIIEDFQVNYFKAFPVIGAVPDPFTRKRDLSLPHWHNAVRKMLADTHSITTQFGRRRRFYGRSYDDSTLREAIAYEPQSMTADEIDGALLRLWRANRVQLLIQVHDSILFQYREEEEDEIVPWALSVLPTRLPLLKGREFVVPGEAKVGWNWGEKDDNNPDGLIKWKGSDTRQRTAQPTPARKQSVADWL